MSRKFAFILLFSIISVDLFAQQTGTVSARSFILTDDRGHIVKLIAPNDLPAGEYIYEIPINPQIPTLTEDSYLDLLKKIDLASSQKQQAPKSDEPYITFATGSTDMTNNRVASAGSGISISIGSGDNSNFTITNAGVLSISGTTNQINTSGSTGDITLSLPQSIHSGAIPTFAGLMLTSIPSSSTSTDLVVSSSGQLQRRTVSSLGLASGSEPIVTFSAGGSTMTNARVLTAGNGVSISVGSGNNGSVTISNTGILGVTSGNGITTTLSNGNVTITNSGVTSVGLSMPSIFTVISTPITTTGTMSVALNEQAAGTFLAAPADENGVPSFRHLASSDFSGLLWTLQGNDYGEDDFIGGVDGNFNPLDFRVNNTTQLRLNDNSSIQRSSGGDMRGFYAVDMQSLRQNNSQIASGHSSTIAGGRANTASGRGSTVGGGGYDGDFVSGNIASAAASTIAGGHGNEAGGDYGTVGGGEYNFAGGYATTVAGGQFNSALNYGGAVAGGIENYASGESAFIGAGTQNNVGGYKSCILGGGNNSAPASMASIVGGENNIASGDSSFVGGGRLNNAAGTGSVISGGSNNYAGGLRSTINGGGSNSANGDFSTAGGYRASASKYGQQSYAAGAFSTSGDAQRSEYLCRAETSDDSWMNLSLNGAGARLTIANNSVVSFTIQISAISSNGDAASYTINGAVKNVSGATSLVGTPSITTVAEDVSDWDVNILADDTNDALTIQVLGSTSVTIRWLASVRTTEVSF